MRSVTIFGATGSIGVNTVDLISRDLDSYNVVALTGGRNVALLAEQAVAVKADLAVTAFDDCFDALKEALAGTGVEVAAGSQAIKEAAHRPADWTMSAIVGAAGLVPGMEALKQGKTLALANKESLVTAGPLLLSEAEKHGATILPVDSEHSAIFQALVGEDINAVERIIVTASGGALRDWPVDALHKATLKDACTHPNWDMGQRITIDSATLFNKAMELIETREFFGVRPDQIEAVVHPESLIHALVGFTDGALMAHLGAPDMRHAIGYALHWPERGHVPVARLDLAKVAQLNFRAADPERFPALRLAYEVMEARGLAGATFNAAKEIALDKFIAGEIGFMQMAELVEATLSTLSGEIVTSGPLTLDGVLAADHLARKTAATLNVAR